MLYRQEGALDIATSYFRQASTAAPAGPARREVADLLFDAGEYPDAIKQYLRLVGEAASDSERADYRSRIIIARLRTRDAAQANKEIDLFLRTYPRRRDDRAAFELEKGHLAFLLKNYDAALKSFQTVSESFDDTPSAPMARYWVGKSLEAAGKYKEAVEQLTDVVRRHPGTPVATRANLALGNIGYTLEKWDDAIRSYRRVVDDPIPDPELLPLAMNNLIETYEATAVYDAALSLTRRYLETYPNADDAFDKRIKIGTLYERLGYYDQAVLHLQGLLEEAGSDLEGEIRYYIAEANYNKGDYQQAILDFLKVPYLVTKKGKIDWTANALYMSGQSYEKMGRHEQALTMYQQILDRPGIDETYRAAARKEIDRVKLVLKTRTN
jgi:TolA-binding protein